MSMSMPYPAQLEFRGESHVARWRPAVQWLLAIPQLIIANALSSVRSVLTLISFFTVLFTKRIPRSLFDFTAMTFRYEWRAMSYALFLHKDYPPFDFQPGSDDDGVEPHSTLTLAYPEELDRWKPLYKWILAVPHYVVVFGLMVASFFALIAGFLAVVFTGEYPEGLRNFLVAAYRYNFRVQAYIGLLTDQYPPFTLS
jgi:hypothetical protein